MRDFASMGPPANGQRAALYVTLCVLIAAFLCALAACSPRQAVVPPNDSDNSGISGSPADAAGLPTTASPPPHPPPGDYPIANLTSPPGNVIVPPELVSNMTHPNRSEVTGISDGPWPFVFLGRIEPRDVQPGQNQTMWIIVMDDQKVASVHALVQTDNNLLNLTLEREPNPYDAVTLPNESRAARYKTTWKVHDVHAAYYNTTFVITEKNGRVTNATAPWSDPCRIPAVGNWVFPISLESPYCTISGVYGIDAGYATLTKNDISQPASVTLASGGTLAYNSGYSISITNNATITIQSGGQLRQTNIWANDTDGDGYYGATTLAAQDTSPGATWYRASSVTNWDCCDSDNRAKYGQTDWYSSQNNCGSWDYDCNGNDDYRYTRDWESRYCYPSDCDEGQAYYENGGWLPQTIPYCGQTDTYYFEGCWYNCQDAQQETTQECH